MSDDFQMDPDFTERPLLRFESNGKPYLLCRTETNALCLLQDHTPVPGLDQQALSILKHLALAANGYHSKLSLHRLAWGLGQERNSDKATKLQRLDTEIHNLRRALGDHRRPWQIITSVSPHGRDSGYHFTPTVAVFERNDAESSFPPATRIAMEEFFGAGVWTRDPEATKGVIILLANALEGLMDGWAQERSKPSGLNRVQKARRWINACDTEGAQAIITEFHNHKINAPTLNLTYEAFPHDTSKALFEITMGGRTIKTKDEVNEIGGLNEIGGGWMRLTETEESGDALSIHTAFEAYTRKFKTVVEEDFLRLLPSNWGPRYIDTWQKKISKPSTACVQDYAAIIRHTKGRKHRKVVFYLFGFTEVGTAAAGYYLAKHWSKLWNTYVHKRTEHWSRGDFLALIEGPSDPYRLPELIEPIEPGLDDPEENRWRLVGAIKPDSEELKKIDCLWTKRRKDAPEN